MHIARVIYRLTTRPTNYEGNIALIISVVNRLLEKF